MKLEFHLLIPFICSKYSDTSENRSSSDPG